MFDNCGAGMTHIESPSHIGIQPQKHAELSGFYKHWTDARIPIYMAIYLDVFTPLKRLSLVFSRISTTLFRQLDESKNLHGVWLN